MYILLFIHLSYGAYPVVSAVPGFRSEYACNYAGKLVAEKINNKPFEFICVKDN